MPLGSSGSLHWHQLLLALTVVTEAHSWYSIFHAVYTGTEDLPALWPTDGSMGEEGGANGEQPQTQSQGEQDTGVLWKAIPWDPQAERAAGALPEVTYSIPVTGQHRDIMPLVCFNILLQAHLQACYYKLLFCFTIFLLYSIVHMVLHWKVLILFSYRLRLQLRIIYFID